jgi:hypothetical protein
MPVTLAPQPLIKVTSNATPSFNIVVDIEPYVKVFSNATPTFTTTAPPILNPNPIIIDDISDLLNFGIVDGGIF